MSDVLRQHVRTARQGTPQSERARPEQKPNNAGGFTFTVDEATRLHRFLTIGTEGGTFHVGERVLTRANGQVVVDLAERSAPVLINQAVKVSTQGRAPSNDPALFALAAAAGLGDQAYRQLALDALPRVARTGTHILTFAAYAEMFRGWGPQLVKGVRNWYLGQDLDNLAYQLLKYKQRKNWSQRDLVRLACFKGSGARVPENYEKVLRYVVSGSEHLKGDLPQLYHAAIAAHGTRSVRQWVRIIGTERSISWEMLPSEALREPEVWRALIAGGNLPQTALIRNLARLTTLGVLRQGDTFTGEVARMIADEQRLVKGRVHPISVLLALKTYAQGRSIRGTGTWSPVPPVIDAMDAAFYAAFGAVEPAGNRVSVSLDISGTMSHAAGGLPISCREVVAAMSLVTVGSEPLATVHGFGHTYMPLDISRRRRLDDVARYMTTLGMQRTDCALPMIEALKERREVDTFVVYTDNETWHGQVHPHQALQNYREKMGIDARLQVVAIVPTEFSIADPRDPRQLDVSGFDSAVPGLLADHGRGDL